MISSERWKLIMGFFGKIFSKKAKVDPAQKEREEKEKNEKAGNDAAEKLKAQHKKNEALILALEKKIDEDSKAAKVAKASGQKEKAIRLLAEVKNSKTQLAKASNMSTLLMKQISNLETSGNDTKVGELLKDANAMLQKNMANQEQLMEVIQDTAQLNDEFDNNQDQVKDLVAQSNARLFEGLDQEFEKLGEAELLDAMKSVVVQPKVQTKQSRKVVAKQKDNFDSMIQSLTN